MQIFSPASPQSQNDQQVHKSTWEKSPEPMSMPIMTSSPTTKEEILLRKRQSIKKKYDKEAAKQAEVNNKNVKEEDVNKNDVRVSKETSLEVQETTVQVMKQLE